MMPPTRADALRRMALFAPRMAADYASQRNHDLGPRSTVSRLSPYLRRRLVTEAEVIAAAIDSHGAQQAAKFIDEVIWRSYFKGWLELRPAIWRSYADGIAPDHANLNEAQRQLYAAVLRGSSGVPCMDVWVAELTTTGYLHNHARMWFASVWVFVFGLPWRLGADFFLRHLLDGDPASNTLGWRWVAGLHTPGKTYHAEAGNIATFTNGRLMPDAAQLAQRFPAPCEPEGLPAAAALRRPLAPDPALPTLLLITEEDCGPCDFNLSALNVRGALGLTASHLRSTGRILPQIAQFEAGALVDALARLGFSDAALHPAADPDVLVAQARAARASQIVTSYVPMGPLRDWLVAATPQLTAAGVTLTEWRRPWDDLIWPDCTAGFFKVKQNIPRYLSKAGLLTASQLMKAMP